MIALQPVSSRMLEAIGYDASTQTLAVRFGPGKVYQYQNVPPEVHAELTAGTESVGVAFGRLVRGKFNHEVVLDEKRKKTMASVNKVILVGNCGRDPEIRYMNDGKAVANVSIATSSRRKDKNTGEVIEDTQWHRVTFYERLAEIVGEYVKKGAPVYVEGRLKYGSYDKDGVKHSTCDIVATELQLLGSRDQGQQRAEAPAQGYGQPRQQPPRQQAPAPRAKPESRPSSGFEDMDDSDIPF